VAVRRDRSLSAWCLQAELSASARWASVTPLVNDNGSADLEFTTDRFTVRELFDSDGSAIIVHEGRDNLANIPDRYHSHTEDVFGPDSATLATGDAGSRLACGVVQRGSHRDDDDSDSDD
jgi:hypothetical protein